MRLIPRAALRRLPPLARRDATIESLRRRVKRLKSQLDSSRESVERPSFQRLIHLDRRVGDHLGELGRPRTSIGPLGKLSDYAIATSCGVDIPVQFGQWDDPAGIAWDDLPDRVVVKSAFGAVSRGVFPLRRVGERWEVMTRDVTMTGAEVAARFASLAGQGKVGGPYFAEEFLDDGSGAPPHDTRVLTFYGEVGLVGLRSAGVHGRNKQARFRFVRPDGSDALVRHPYLPIDSTIPIPAALDELVDVAARLSIAVREPYVRIDLYRIHDRVVFGEVTRRPGGAQWHGPEIDRELGEMWERARARIRRDSATGQE